METDGKREKEKYGNKVYQLKKKLRSFPWLEIWHALFVAVIQRVTRHSQRK